MVKSALSKVAWVGRTASMVFGLALVLALVLGVASMALGDNGDFFKVGRANFASAVSVLTKSGAGPALSLRVDSGPALKVNSAAKVTNLNADKLDGKDAGQIGISSVERHAVASVTDSVSSKRVTVACPEGTVLVGNSGYVVGGYTGTYPNMVTDVSLVTLDASSSEAVAYAMENDPTDANWAVVAVAQCATRP